MKNIKKITCILFLISLFSCSSNRPVTEVNSNTKKTSTITQNWNYEELATIILSEFPEAYSDFMEISFERTNSTINPKTATFLIPSAKMTKLNAAIFEKRLDAVLKKMGSHAEGSCRAYRIGEKKAFAWSQWKDKNVTIFYIDFNLGC